MKWILVFLVSYAIQPDLHAAAVATEASRDKAPTASRPTPQTRPAKDVWKPALDLSVTENLIRDALSRVKDPSELPEESLRFPGLIKLTIWPGKEEIRPAEVWVLYSSDAIKSDYSRATRVSIGGEVLVFRVYYLDERPVARGIGKVFHISVGEQRYKLEYSVDASELAEWWCKAPAGKTRPGERRDGGGADGQTQANSR